MPFASTGPATQRATTTRDLRLTPLGWVSPRSREQLVEAFIRLAVRSGSRCRLRQTEEPEAVPSDESHTDLVNPPDTGNDLNKDPIKLAMPIAISSLLGMIL